MDREGAPMHVCVCKFAPALSGLLQPSLLTVAASDSGCK